MPVLTPVDLSDLPATLADFWTEYHLCILSTLDREGAPHAVPVGAILDPEEQCAWVITRRGSQKVTNLRRDPRLTISQVDRGRWSTLVGTAEVLEDEGSVARACEMYASRYRTPSPNPERVAIRITIDRVLGSTQVLSDA
ncbi:acyltransferase [Nocardioides sp. Root190]|uniref:pyridoxamine 5'-phosphate oxidase family protein n=1 Tax=Nocardioides sp. Root190 TaxID=1736488 RepID=UPI0007017290|nr:PPOX class F420-dependent oxidoreductase [Nocardioides sp. Root190]KRB76230.1 acyltransferase [Nocardioides sp. Root190]